MSAEDVVRASLKGLELGETVCIPGLHDLGYLQRFLEARTALAQNAVRSGTPAPRYG